MARPQAAKSEREHTVENRCVVALLFFAAVGFVRADGPKDNLAANVRPVPPPGIEVPAADRGELEAGVESLGKEISSLRTLLYRSPNLSNLIPDVQIYHNAVRYALTYNEFYKPAEIAAAKTLLKQG